MWRRLKSVVVFGWLKRSYGNLLSSQTCSIRYRTVCTVARGPWVAMVSAFPRSCCAASVWAGNRTFGADTPGRGNHPRCAHHFASVRILKIDVSFECIRC
jgi:hypothetical protein